MCGFHSGHRESLDVAVPTVMSTARVQVMVTNPVTTVPLPQFQLPMVNHGPNI
jgi:hypothetical protein